tara:strand:+ start:272 stop:463 length:192 start_codon:yes stop_codon:yes gene_type:complete
MALETSFVEDKVKVGDLVITCESEYGIVAGFWNGDVSNTLYVHVYMNGEISTFHPAELEIVCK